MPHDASKVLMGSTRSNHRKVTQLKGDPATFKAGLRICLNSSDGPSLAKADGQSFGISLGKNLSNIAGAVAVCRKGEGVPVLLAAKRASGNATITSYANLVSGTPDSITIGATVFTAGSGAATPGAATFQAATSNNDTATSLAAQINAHATAGALVKAVAAGAVVNLYARAGGTAGNAIALAYTNGDANVGATVSGANLSGGAATPDYVVKGAKAYFNDTNGLADFSTTESTVSDAVYVSGVLTGIQEDGTEAPVALVDMVGGL